MKWSASASFAAWMHFLVGRIQPPVADVLHDGVGEQERVLQHQPQLAAQVGLAHVADIRAVDGDLPLVDLVEARQQVDDRRLARARRARPGRSFRPACASSVMSLMIG